MTDHVPERCPVCSTSIPAGRDRCPGCGKVFGEANRCPSCRAVAAVREVGPRQYACTACGAPRRRVRGTAVDSGFADELGRRARLLRWSSYALWPLAGSVTLFGVAVLGMGAGLASGGWQTAGYVVGGGALLCGVPLLLLARHLGVRARRLREGALDARLVLAAARHHGTLTAEAAARELASTADEADRRLTELAKQGRLGLEVDDEGVVRYRVAETAGGDDFDAEALAASSREGREGLPKT